jgi:cyclopropane-fatty-acyl-phospholipid synthase
MSVTEDRRVARPSRVDPHRWPDVATANHAPVRAAVARLLFRRAAERLPLRVVEGGGRWYGGGGTAAPMLRLVRPRRFFHRLGATGTIGFGEAYMAGDWTADDLSGVLTAFAAHIHELVPPPLRRLRHLVLRRQPEADDNTISGARRNIHRHYDMSNEMFQVFLDESMTYSSALYHGDPAASRDSLATAQRRKIDRLLDATGVTDGTRVFEIGTGWGELAIRAARRGATVPTITLSTGQAKLAQDRISAAGLSDRVTVLVRDYRECDGQFDVVLSVEMIEAVGARHWPAYFHTTDRLLVPGGRFGLQAIVQEDAAARASGETYTWIRKYIFPGGQLASVPMIMRIVRDHTGLRIADRLMFGQHYAETLRRWRSRFEAAAEQVTRIGFDETFRRMWSLYLAYSEAGFRTGYLDVGQFLLAKPG